MGAIFLFTVGLVTTMFGFAHIVTAFHDHTPIDTGSFFTIGIGIFLMAGMSFTILEETLKDLLRHHRKELAKMLQSTPEDTSKKSEAKP